MTKSTQKTPSFDVIGTTNNNLLVCHKDNRSVREHQTSSTKVLNNIISIITQDLLQRVRVSGSYRIRKMAQKREMRIQMKLVISLKDINSNELSSISMITPNLLVAQ